MLISKISNSISSRLFKFFLKKKFNQFGEKSNIIKPLNVQGIHNISIGNEVYVGYKTWLAAMPLAENRNCELVIGDGTTIGNFNHIYATKSIIIGQNVLTADKVYISDNLHSYEDVTIPIKNQPVKQIGTVSIGDGTWIGENACIIGAKIGKNCVVGANAVITKDVPDYCVVVGIPAKIIKQFDQKKNRWVTL